jgi:eukaryotic-like serine/threonine-protein kinase
MENIPGYEILESLGKSTWGDSFKARQISLNRPVRLTILPPREKAAPVHELARISAALTHAHLVSGIDMGTCPSGTYLVTEWVEGPAVGDIVRKTGGIAEDRVLEILLAAAQALDHAARKGLIHDNITPESIFIARGGTPKLRGFGPDRKSSLSPLDWRSPEKKRGEVRDVRSDIYSLGAILHYLLSGLHPFEDAPPAEVVDGEVVEVPIPLRQVARRVSPEVEQLALRMMAHSPEDRFASAGELAEEIENLMERLDGKVDIRSGRTARPAARRTRPTRTRRTRRRR